MTGPSRVAETGTDQDEVLFDLVERLTQKVQNGEVLDVDALIKEYPQYAPQLRKTVATLQGLAALTHPPTSAPSSPHSRAADDQVNANQTLGDYRVIREIGRGGMGVVYQAEQLSLHRQVALKVLPFAAVLDPRQLKRFQFEAQAAAQLHHSNIVPVFSVGCERGVHYYAMQYIEGRTLAEVISDLRRLEGVDHSQQELQESQQHLVHNGDSSEAPQNVEQSPTRSDSRALSPSPTSSHLESPSDTSRTIQAVLSTERSTQGRAFCRAVALLGAQVADALSYAHDQGVIHRDIKPSNLILDTVGTVWITDFGLARAQGNQALTMTGDVLGTLRYMSPEQALAKRVFVDHRTDIYSLGVTLYEFLTLRPAYDGSDREELLRQITLEEPRSARRWNKAIPSELETIINKAMIKNPAERYATAGDLADDLRRFLADQPIHARRATWAQRLAKWSRRHRSVVVSLAVASAIMLLVTAIGGLLTGRMIAARQQLITAQQREIADQERAGRIAVEKLLGAGYLDQGQALAEQGEIGRGMLWFARSLQVAPEDAKELQNAARASLAAWSHHLHRLRMILQFPGFVHCMAFSPDHRQILVAGSDQTVRIWNTVTGRSVGSPLKHDSPLRALAVSPDGMRFVTGTEDGTVRVWDASKLNTVGEPLKHGGSIRTITYRRDGSRIAIACNDGRFYIYDARELKRVGEPLALGRPQVLAATDEGLRGLVVVEDGRQQLWDLDRIQPVGPPAEGVWRPAAISANGSTYVARRPGATLVFWNGTTGKKEPLEIRQGGALYAIAFSPDGSQIVSGGNTRAVVIWDANTGEPIGTPLRQPGAVGSIAYSRDGSFVATSNVNGTVRIWEVARHRSRGQRLQHEDRILSAAFSRDGLRLLTERDGMVQLRDAKTGEPLGKPFPPQRLERLLIFSPDETRLLTKGPWDGCIRDVASGKMLFRVPGTIYGFAFSPDGSCILVGSQFRAHLWDLETGEPIGDSLDHRQPVAGVAFVPNSSLLVTGSYDGTTQFWNAATQEPIGDPVDHQSEVKSLACSRDGKRMLVGCANGTVRLWDIQDPLKPHPIGVPLHHREIVNQVAFSPDDSRLLTFSLDGTARLWDAATLKPLGPALEHEGWWAHIAFNHTGSQLLVTSGVDAAWIWRTPPGAVTGSKDQIRLWTEVITGLQMDDTGGIAALDNATWQARQRELQELGQVPDAFAPEPVEVTPADATSQPIDHQPNG